MKKLLVASTALVAVAAVSPAQAADPIKLSVGGFMNQMVGYVDAVESVNGTEVQNIADVINTSDTELYFRGSTKLDNGLTVAVAVDLETDRDASSAARTAANRDDVFMSISSDSLGTVELGATKDVFYDMAITAPVGGIGLTDGDWDAFYGYGENDDDTKGISGADGQKVNYWTPNFGGFQAGFTYGVNAAGNTGGDIDLRTAGNDLVYAVAAAYRGEFSGVSVGANAGYITNPQGGANNGENDPTSTHFGLSVGAAGFTVAGALVNSKDVGGTVDRDMDAWEIGASYATGPYTVSAGFMNIEDDNGTATNADDEDFTMLVGAVDYDLGAGVSASVSVFAGENEVGVTSGTTDKEAWGLVTGIRAAF